MAIVLAVMLGLVVKMKGKVLVVQGAKAVVVGGLSLCGVTECFCRL